MKNTADPKQTGKEEWLAKLRAEGNTKLSKNPPTKPQEPLPTLFPDLVWVWSAFCFMSERRGLGPNGPVPITVEAIDAFSRLTNRREREYLDQLLLFVPVLDRAYLKDFYDKQKADMDKEQKKREQQARKGAPRTGGRRNFSQRRR